MAFLKTIMAGLSTAVKQAASGTWQPKGIASVFVIGLLVGAVWLAVETSTDEMVAALAGPVSEEELAAACECLDSRDLAYRIRDGRIFVAKKDLKSVRSVLAEERLGEVGQADGLTELLSAGDLWRSQAQNDKRWQAAKMAKLSRLIEQFPAVESAAVLFESGRPAKPGRAAVAASAAVKVVLNNGAVMTTMLTDAIANLVSGSVAGLARSDVRIVDGKGLSHRASPEIVAQALGSAEQVQLCELQAAERRCAEKLRQMLRYTEAPMVAAKFRPAANGPVLAGVWVGIPRSHLLAVHLAGGGLSPHGEDEMRKLALPQLDKIRKSVANLLNVEGDSAIHVDYYLDKAASPTPAQAIAGEGGEVSWGHWPPAICVGAVVFCVAGGLFVAARKRSKRVASADAAQDGQAEAKEEHAGRDITEKQMTSPSPGALAFLEDLSPDELLAIAQVERAQAAALMLSNVRSERAAIVLARLDRDKRAEVVRRLVGLSSADGGLVREAERCLAGKLSELVGRLSGESDSDSAEDKVADILHQAGYQTARAVLADLHTDQPALAESIRRRMPAFEDIGRFPPEQLALAVESVDCEDLAVAMRTAGRDVRRRIFSALSSSASRRVKQDMSRIGPVRLSDVEAAQRQVVEAIFRTRYGQYVSEVEPMEDSASGGRGQVGKWLGS